jgi:hypothetical protein
MCTCVWLKARAQCGASFYTPQNQFFLMLVAGVINPGAAYAHTAMRACLSSGSIYTEGPIKKTKRGVGDARAKQAESWARIKKEIWFSALWLLSCLALQRGVIMLTQAGPCRPDRQHGGLPGGGGLPPQRHGRLPGGGGVVVAICPPPPPRLNSRPPPI